MSEWASPYFTRAEFSCKCGCGFDTVDYELIKVLEYIREHFDKPVVVNSGCRCPAHNDSVDGSVESQHLLGRAADISVNGVEPALVYELSEQIEVGGLGSYDTFTHVDTRVGYARW
jgi:uncharacterized protein YcbK (DUF882 family)